MPRHIWRAFERREQVEVPLAEQMDDETFLKHLEFRHAEECLFEKTPIARHAMDKWIPMYRTFHERLHHIALPEQHDHHHEDEEF